LGAAVLAAIEKSQILIEDKFKDLVYGTRERHETAKRLNMSLEGDRGSSMEN
jgi:hypothetical protein